MKKIILGIFISLLGCQTSQQAIPPGEQTYRCSVSDYGQVNCEPEQHFKNDTK